MIKSIAQSKSHLFMLCEATNVTQGEKDFLYARGWQTIQNNSGDILIGSRTNLVGSSLTRLAGSTLVGEAHAHLPLTYMIVEIIYGKTLPLGGQGNRGEFPDSSYTRVLERAGTDRARVCAFHLNNIVASKRVSVAHCRLYSLPGRPDRWWRQHGTLQGHGQQTGVDGYQRRNVPVFARLPPRGIFGVSGVSALVLP